MKVFALACFVFAVAVGFAGVMAYGDDMAVNLLSGLFELFLGIAAAVFLVATFEARQRERQWRLAYQAINGLLAASFVDIMRLLSVGMPGGYIDDPERYPEFLEIASFHANSLRSAIEGFALGVEPRSLMLARQSELQLAWLIQRLSRPNSAPISTEWISRCRVLAQDIATLFERQGDEGFEQAHHLSKQIVGRLPGGSAPDYPATVSVRYACQEELIRELGLAGRSGGYIFDDVDNTLAISYFALDLEILDSSDAR